MTQELQEKFHQEFMNVMLLYNEKILRQIKSSFKDTFSPAQFFTLSAIVSNNGLSMSQLAQMSSMQKQQVTKLVGFLADAGYICRIQNQKDRRIITVKATEKGTAFMEEYCRKSLAEISLLFSTLTENESQELFTALSTINRLFKKLQPASGIT